MQNLSACSMATTLKAELCLYRCESCTALVPAVGSSPLDTLCARASWGFTFSWTRQCWMELVPWDTPGLTGCSVTWGNIPSPLPTRSDSTNNTRQELVN